MAAASIDDATGVIRTTSAFAADRPTPKKAPAAAHAEEDDGPLSQSHVAMLWTHYQTARGTLERLAGEAKGTGGLDVHSPFVERALRLLEVLVLRKEKVSCWGSGSWGVWIDFGWGVARAARGHQR